MSILVHPTYVCLVSQGTKDKIKQPVPQTPTSNKEKKRRGAEYGDLSISRDKQDQLQPGSNLIDF